MKGLSWLIEITVMNEDIRVEEEITYLELSKKYKEMFDGPIMGVRVGNTLKELTAKVSDGEEIVFVDPSRPEGMSIYMRTVCMVMLKAVRDVLGNEAEVVIENSIKKNFYC